MMAPTSCLRTCLSFEDPFGVAVLDDEGPAFNVTEPPHPVTEHLECLHAGPRPCIEIADARHLRLLPWQTQTAAPSKADPHQSQAALYELAAALGGHRSPHVASIGR
jgi:hypothetical protein